MKDDHLICCGEQMQQPESFLWICVWCSRDVDFRREPWREAGAIAGTRTLVWWATPPHAAPPKTICE